MACVRTGALAFFLLTATVGCGDSVPSAQAPARALPPYSDHATELFDDGMEPSAVGYDLGPGRAPMADPLLRERARLGDAVVRARVRTVTSKEGDRGRSWQLGLHTIERLAGRGPVPEADFTLWISPEGPSAGILRALEGRLIGMVFVTFLREFARAGSPGESDLHFHVSRDGKDEVNAVQASALFDQMR